MCWIVVIFGFTTVNLCHAVYTVETRQCYTAVEYKINLPRSQNRLMHEKKCSSENTLTSSFFS